MKQYILAIDQGTTSSRAIIFDTQPSIVAVAQQEFTQHFPADGWVEHEAKEIWQSTLAVCREVLNKAGLSASELASIGITNQRETTLLWDKTTGEALHNAIVWQDRRTADYCDELKQQGHEDLITSKTGLLLDPYFSATKLKWLLDEVPGARQRAEQGELAFGTVDSYLIWHLSGNKVHKTDASNASRTLLFNIHQQCWDEQLLTLFDIPAAVLPEVCDNAHHYCDTDAELLGAPVPVTGVAGDQQAALIGQACFSSGMAKSTYGTGCFLMINTGNQAITSENRLLTTVAYRINGETTYALEGSIFVAGAAVQWLRDGLKIIDSAPQTEDWIIENGDTNGVYMVPAFTGLGAPYWDPHARGALLGLTRDSGIAEIVTATLQSVCLQTNDLMRAIAADGQSLQSLRVDGGMVGNNWLVQELANTLDVSVSRPELTETTALGAAYLAGLQVGVYDSLEQVASGWAEQAQFQPQLDAEVRAARYAGWQQAVAKVRSTS